MEHITPSVGLMTLAGCLTFLVAPNDEPSPEARIAAVLNPSLPVVVIDPGHGGHDEGARDNGLVEKDLTLDLAFRVDKLLKSSGFTTVFTREKDVFVSLPDRTTKANQFDRALFVSLHFNKANNKNASGIETFFAPNKVAPEPTWSWAGFFAKPPPPKEGDLGEDLAAYVQTALINRTEAGDRGIKRKVLYVVRHTTMPAILVEGGFISNAFEAKLISTPEYRDRLADAVTQGVIAYSKTLPRPPRPHTQLAKSAP